MKKVKQVVSAFLCLYLLLLSVLTFSAGSARAVTVQKIEGTEYVCLDDLKNGSDITIEQKDNTVTLCENGLQIQLRTDAVWAYRDGHIIGSMQKKPVLTDGKWYVSKDFYDNFLCRKEGGVLSLFHGTLFYEQEVLAALAGSGDAAFNQKLLSAVLLPTSMGIMEPHVDMFRVFSSKPLSEYPAALAAKLTALGFQNAGQMTYSEYVVVNGAQTLTVAGMASVIDKNPELKGKDPGKMTVAEYTEWEREHTQQQYEKELSAEAKTFAKENEIQLSDLAHLNRYFNGGYMDKSKDELKKVLTEYYAADIGRMQDSSQTFKDVKKSDWFFEDVMYAMAEDLMNGTSEMTFSPNSVISRGQIVTILWRLEGKPVVNYRMQFEDVPEGQWFSEAIRWAASEKIVNGYGNTFGTNYPITREQFAAILWRYTKYKGINVETEKDAALNFDDAQSISEYAVEAMQWACKAELMKGNAGKLLPANTATRAEAAAMTQRFCKNILKK